MSSNWRRFEVLLPLQFNDGREVPPEWLAGAVLEIVDYFGAESYETQKVERHWRYGGVLLRHDLVKIVVDVSDTAENRQWLKNFKDKWKSRLEQLDLWVIKELFSRHSLSETQKRIRLANGFLPTISN